MPFCSAIAKSPDSCCLTLESTSYRTLQHRNYSNYGIFRVHWTNNPSCTYTHGWSLMIIQLIYINVLCPSSQIFLFSWTNDEFFKIILDNFSSLANLLIYYSLCYTHLHVKIWWYDWRKIRCLLNCLGSFSSANSKFFFFWKNIYVLQSWQYSLGQVFLANSNRSVKRKIQGLRDMVEVKIHFIPEDQSLTFHSYISKLFNQDILWINFVYTWQ